MQLHCRPKSWPKKAELYIVRTDGMSCSRETVRGKMCTATISLQLPALVENRHAL